MAGFPLCPRAGRPGPFWAWCKDTSSRSQGPHPQDPISSPRPPDPRAPGVRLHLCASGPRQESRVCVRVRVPGGGWLRAGQSCLAGENTGPQSWLWQASWSPLSLGATVVLPWEVEAAWAGGLEMLCLASPWPRGICASGGAITESGRKLSFWAGVCTPHCLQPPCPGSGLPRSLVPCLETPMGSVCQDGQPRAPSTAFCFPPLPWG